MFENEPDLKTYVPNLVVPPLKCGGRNCLFRVVVLHMREYLLNEMRYKRTEKQFLHYGKTAVPKNW